MEVKKKKVNYYNLNYMLVILKKEEKEKVTNRRFHCILGKNRYYCILYKLLFFYKSNFSYIEREICNVYIIYFFLS